MRKKLLKGIARLCLLHYRMILILFLVILGIAFLLTGSLRFDPDFLKLFPAEKGPIKLYMENLKQAGTFNLLLVLLEKNEKVDPQQLIDSGRKIADSMKALEINGKKAFRFVRFQRIEEDFNEAKSVLALFLAHPYLFMDEEDIPELKEKWSETEIARQVRKNKKALISHASFAVKDLIQIDPFEVRWVFMEKWKGEMRGMEFDELSPFFLSKDRNFLLIIGEPFRPATELLFTRSLMDALEKTVSDVHYSKDDGVKIFFTGAHPIALSEAKTLRFDMQSSFVTSLILVLILFFFAYRRWVTLLFAGLPLFGGIQLTMGIASLTLGSLNILTSAFSAILVGLGIDFAIHLYDRYHHERAMGVDISSAIEITLTQTGNGIWTGAFTTIFAFAILYCSQVRGIVELSFLVSVGLLSTLICIYFVLPSFLIWVDQRKKPYRYQPLQTLGLKHLPSLLEKNASLFFFGFIGITLFFIFLTFQVQIEKDFRNLRPKEIQALVTLDRLTQAFGGKKMEALVIHEGRELLPLLMKEEELIRTFQRNQREGELHSFTSLSKLIPSPEKQGKISRVIRESINLQRVKENFTKSLKENGFELSEFQPIIQSLEELNRGDEKIFPPETLMASLHQGPFKKGIEHFLTQKEGTYKLVSRLYYQKGRLSLDRLEKGLEGISITGPERMESEIMRIVKDDLLILTPIAFLIVFFLVFLHFRTWKSTLFVLTPLVVGLIWMVGTMSLMGIRINFVNAIVLPMIIGMGIDNGVHLMHRYLEGERRDIGLTLRTTGRAMIMCSLTTMLGFGSLVTARYQALSTMGWVTILGMGFCLITSLCFLPVLLIQWKRKHHEQ